MNPKRLRPHPGDSPTQSELHPDDRAQALIASDLRYRWLFESARDGILILDAETGMVMDVNPFLIELLGFSREAFIGKKVWELGFFKDIVASQADFAELQRKEYVRYKDQLLVTTDGRRIDVEFISNVYLLDQQKEIQQEEGRSHYRPANRNGGQTLDSDDRRGPRPWNSARDTRPRF